MFIFQEHTARWWDCQEQCPARDVQLVLPHIRWAKKVEKTEYIESKKANSQDCIIRRYKGDKIAGGNEKVDGHSTSCGVTMGRTLLTPR